MDVDGVMLVARTATDMCVSRAASDMFHVDCFLMMLSHWVIFFWNLGRIPFRNLVRVRAAEGGLHYCSYESLV